jgi:hypothetical protein
MKLTGRIVVMTALMAGCDILGPKPVCGCSPLGGGTAVIAGRVLTASDAPAPGASVTWELLTNAPCQNSPTPSLMKAVVTANNDGRFRHTTSWSGGNKCFRVFARAQGATSGSPSSDTQVVNINFALEGPVPDSVELLLRLK